MLRNSKREMREEKKDFGKNKGSKQSHTNIVLVLLHQYKNSTPNPEQN